MPKKKDIQEPSTSLLALHSQYESVAAELTQMGGELTPETEAALDQVMQQLCEKADGYGAVMEKLEFHAGFWKFQKDKCAQAQKVFENAAERLKERMKLVLRQMPNEELQGEFHRFFLSDLKDTLDINAAILPDRFKRLKVEHIPDRDLIETALIKKEEVPGVTVKTGNKALRSGRPK